MAAVLLAGVAALLALIEAADEARLESGRHPSRAWAGDWPRRWCRLCGR